MLEIKQNNESFYIGDDYERRTATLVFTIEDQIMSLTETEVDESLRGQGVAGKLVDRAVEYARENELKIKPVCSYTVARLSKDEYKDIVV